MTALAAGDDDEALKVVLKRLRELRFDVYAADVSTDEAIRYGMRVVRVIVPALQPLSFHYRARYLGHPRLYEAPRRMGYRAWSERQLNHWPQPFN
jgi:ribosomal protein S12 methylthiotransferase accessory factor